LKSFDKENKQDEDTGFDSTHQVDLFFFVVLFFGGGVVLVVCFAVLEIEPRAMCTLGKSLPVELCHQPFCLFVCSQFCF
jgi:hypothetical protein